VPFVQRTVHKYTFVGSARNQIPIKEWCFGLIVGRELGLTDLLVIMVVEDDQLIQGLVEEALSDGGFETAIAGSGEEAVTLLRGNRSHYRALVTDINLLGTMDGWEVAKQARDRSRVSGCVHDGRSSRPVGVSRRSQQHSFIEAIRPGTACHGNLQSSKHGHAAYLGALIRPPLPAGALSSLPRGFLSEKRHYKYKLY
jgi:CheY-like chemotaxis protein